MNIRPGDLAVVIKGLWPNVGRVVYVDRFVERWDFTRLGLGHGPGWRVRSWSHGPLDTVDGPRFAGYTPQGSLKPLDPLPPDQARRVQQQMAIADFKEAMNDLAEILQQQDHGQRTRRAKPHRRTRASEREPSDQAPTLNGATAPDAAEQLR